MSPQAKVDPFSEEVKFDLQGSESEIAFNIRPPVWAQWLAWFIEQPLRTALILVCLDMLAGAAGLLAGYFLSVKCFGAGADAKEYIHALVSYNCCLILVFYLISGYNHIRSRRHEEELRIIVIACNWAMVLVLITNFIFYKDIIFSRYIIIIWYLISLISLVILRFSLRVLLKILWRYGLARENTVIIGDSSKDIKWLLQHLHIQRYGGINILGYLSGKVSSFSELPYLGRFDNLADVVEDKKINKVFFAMHGYSEEKHMRFLNRLEECYKLKLTAMIITEIFNNFNFSLSIDGYTDILAIDCRIPAYSKPAYRFIKRFMDMFGGLLFVFVSWPLWVVIPIAIKLSDGGPVFFKHRLVGKDGKTFQALKFRTMVTNAEELLQNNPRLLEEFKKNYKLQNDPRVTRIGRWLRISSLDELPQIINILKGDMSLVGPRPVKEIELDRYGKFKFERIKLRPGLTGFWQVNGRCATDYEERIQMDKFYMYKCSIWMDLIILLKTPVRVLKGEGAL